MPKNVTVAHSGKMSLQETIIKILVFTLAVSRLFSKVYLFSLRLSRIIFASHWSHQKVKIEWLYQEEYTLESRLSESVKNDVFFNYVGNRKELVIG